jgi:N-dimethylarginine dimethylaminohydrolase
MPLYRSARKLDFALADLPRLSAPRRVLMADPAEFEVASALNPHMVDERGALKRVDRVRARGQWLELKRAFERLGLAVEVLAPLPGQPDLVFCANQALPIPGEALPDGRPRAVPSNMRWPERRGEVEHVVTRLASLGFAVERLATRERVEGMGDGLWHPGRRLLWAGIGPRSSVEAWSEVAERFDLPVVALELADPAFYHLDTALALLAEDACLWFPGALSERSRELVERLVPRRVVADEREARELLACNATGPDGRHVLLQRGCERTVERLRAEGFEPVELETSEFLKSGGSVFCMKLLL